MGAMTNNGRKAAVFAGWYKGVQSVGNAIIYGIDNAHAPYMNIFASCWGLLAGSLVIAAPVILWKIEDTTVIEKDIKFSDETIEEVVADPELVNNLGRVSTVNENEKV
jgi:hypothetical protein